MNEAETDSTARVTREEVKNFLWDTGMRRVELGRRVGVSLSTVNGWMSNLEIPVRKQALLRAILDSYYRKQRSPHIPVKCTESEADEIRHAAELLGESVEEFCVRACRVRALAVLGGREIKIDDSPHRVGTA